MITRSQHEALRGQMFMIQYLIPASPTYRITVNRQRRRTRAGQTGIRQKRQSESETIQGRQLPMQRSSETPPMEDAAVIVSITRLSGRKCVNPDRKNRGDCWQKNVVTVRIDPTPSEIQKSSFNAIAGDGNHQLRFPRQSAIRHVIDDGIVVPGRIWNELTTRTRLISDITLILVRSIQKSTANLCA